jgi:oligoendopeptidase F
MQIDLALVLRHLPGAILLAASTIPSAAQERDRSKIADQYKWDLTAIYPSDEAWRAAKEKLAAQLPELHKFQGTLGSSAAKLADALETQSRLDKERTRAWAGTRGWSRR